MGWLRGRRLVGGLFIVGMRRGGGRGDEEERERERERERDEMGEVSFASLGSVRLLVRVLVGMVDLE